MRTITDHKLNGLNPNRVNRFFNAASFALAELMPQALQARGIPFTDPLFILQGAMRYNSSIADGVIVVPDGFETDLASIPSVAWSLFMEPDDPRISAAAVIHDYLCGNNGTITLEGGRRIHLSSTQAAKVLAYEAMPDLMATTFQQWAVFNAVNTFGPHWS